MDGDFLIAIADNEMHNELSREIQKVHNFESLVDFLQESLNWPIPDEGLEFDDITYDWSAADLELDPAAQARIICCRQLRLFNLEFDLPTVRHELDANTQARQQLLIKLGVLEDQQPWGIFFIQFDDDVELDACRTLLRRVLRGLVDRRNRSVSLPFWRHDQLLFIYTTANFQSIGFTCFSGEKSRPIVDDYIPLIHFKLDA